MKNVPILIQAFENIKKLPEDKISEVNDFVEFLLSKIDNQLINDGIDSLVKDSKSFDFLKDEPDIYSLNDIKEKYNDKR